MLIVRALCRPSQNGAAGACDAIQHLADARPSGRYGEPSPSPLRRDICLVPGCREVRVAFKRRAWVQPRTMNVFQKLTAMMKIKQKPNGPARTRFRVAAIAESVSTSDDKANLSTDATCTPSALFATRCGSRMHREN